MWDVATGNGYIAAAALVTFTKTKEFSLAAKKLLNRDFFSPKFTYSDTWPHKKEYWEDLINGLEGRLGLFHYEKIILRNLRKKHVDYAEAINSLLDALYSYCPHDYERLLAALKDGALSATDKKFTSEEIADITGNKMFQDQYGGFLRNQLRPPETMAQNLSDWFCCFKVTSYDPEE